MEAEQWQQRLQGGLEPLIDPNTGKIDTRDLKLRRFIDLIVIINPIFLQFYANI